MQLFPRNVNVSSPRYFPSYSPPPLSAPTEYLGDNIAKDRVLFAGFLDRFRAKTSAKAAAKNEAKTKNESLINWGKLATKFVFKTSFSIIKQFVTRETVKAGFEKLKDVASGMDEYILHGWEVAKEHLLPALQTFVEYITEHMGPILVQLGRSAMGLSFAGNTSSTQNKETKSPGHNSSSSPFSLAQDQTQQISSAGLQKPTRDAIHRDYIKAITEFERAAKKPHTSINEREANAIRLGAKMFNSLLENLAKEEPSLSNIVLKDAREIANELNTIAYNTARAEKFNDLTETNQDRLIDLITATLQHSEPLISQFGLEMAQSIGLKQETIELLRHS